MDAIEPVRINHSHLLPYLEGIYSHKTNRNLSSDTIYKFNYSILSSFIFDIDKPFYNQAILEYIQKNMKRHWMDKEGLSCEETMENVIGEFGYQSYNSFVKELANYVNDKQNDWKLENVFLQFEFKIVNDEADATLIEYFNDLLESIYLSVIDL